MIMFDSGVYQPHLGAGRREAKYILSSEALAAAVREAIRPHMEPDPHAVGLPGNCYSLASLYLDTPSLDFYRDTVMGEKNRHKLRVRQYRKPGAPAFFEVKSKVNEIIRKRRAAVKPEVVADLVAGALPRRSHLFKERSNDLVDLLFFRDLMQQGEATPRMRVRYDREPWLGRHDRGVRITFDRQVEGSPTTSSDVLGLDATWVASCQLPVILEVKFNRTMPEWVTRFIRRFDLVRTSVPKYVLSIDAWRDNGVNTAGQGWRVHR